MPDWKHIVRQHLVVLRLPPEREIEIVEELALHFEAAYEDALADGLSEEESETRALQSYDWRLLECELVRVERPLPRRELIEGKGGFRMESLLQDLRFGLRMLLKRKGFTAVAVLTLALGIGANTAIFSVVNALIVQPLPYPHSERLVWLEEVSKQTGESRPAWGGHFLAWQEQSQTLSGIAAIDGGVQTLTGTGEPERVDVGQVSAGFLPMLNAQPLPGGRNFTVSEDAPGSARVAILTHSLWQRRFDGEQNIIGKPIVLNDTEFTVVGVLPPDFRFFYRFDVFVPLALDPQQQLAGDARYFGTTVARIKPGVSVEQSLTELDTLQQRYEMTRPEGSRRIESRTRAIPLQEQLLGERRRPLLVLLGAVALVLLIACANVGNLLLARAGGRTSELAIRAALGASRLHLIRQMLIECLVLAVMGGGAGLLLAYWLTGFLGSLNAVDTFGEMGRMAKIAIDSRVLGFTLVISLITGLLFGLLPALRLSRPDLNDSLKAGGRGNSPQGRRLRSALMVGEVAMAIVLLVGAGLLIRSFAKLLHVDPGYRAENLLTARISLPPRYQDNSRRVQFYDQLLQRLAAVPGVVSSAVTSHLPLTNYNLGGRIRVEGRSVQPGELGPSAPVARVSPDYFHTMGIGLLSGRTFNGGDTEGAPGVALLSEALARKLFSNEDALGRRLTVADLKVTVIGVVRDIRYSGLDGEAEQAVYLSYRQLPRPGMALVLRSALEPLSLTPALRNAVRELDSALPVFDVLPMEARLSNSVAARRFNLALLGGFAALALALAGIGVYGVVAYVVTERTREVGIRMALGAQRSDVMRLFIKQGMALALLGVALGLLGALALRRVISAMLFNVGANDPITFGAVAFLLSVVALLACYLPARRASHSDPLVSMRRE